MFHFTYSLRSSRIVSHDFVRLSKEHSVDDMIKILSKAKTGEGYIIDPKGLLIGKILLPEILLISNKKLPPNKKLYKNFLSLNSKSNVLEAIDKIKNFVGESVPVIENNQRMLGVITESDLFNELVSAENSRKKEELSD